MINAADGNSVYYYHFDGLGSVVALSDETGVLVESYSYSVFGEPDTTSIIGNRFMFTGREYDAETGLSHYRARAYKPSIGRFLQTDPIGYADSMNMYAYCVNSPTNRADPTGFASVALYDGGDSGDKGTTSGEGFRNSAQKYDYSFDVRSPGEAKKIVTYLKQQGVTIDDVYIMDHGQPGAQSVGNSPLVAYSDDWKSIAECVEPGGTVHLLGCFVANSEQGLKYLQMLAEWGNCNVEAYGGVVVFLTDFGEYFSLSTLWSANAGKSCPSIKRQALFGYSATEQNMKSIISTTNN